jgi:hypothetical protein
MCGVLLWSVLGAVPAGAVAVSGGCKGTGESSTADRDPLDEAAAPESRTGTRDNPFVVEYDGTVHYEGSTPSIFKNHKWNVKTFGITVKSGGSKNGSNATEDERTISVDDYLPFDAPGLYYVSGSIKADGGKSCSGHIYVKIAGSPTGSIPWIIGLILTILGLITVLMSTPRRTLDAVKRHPIRGFLGGVMLGLGVSLLLATYAKIVFGRPTFLILWGAIAVVSLLLCLFAPARGGGGAPPPAAPSEPPPEPPAEETVEV